MPAAERADASTGHPWTLTGPFSAASSTNTAYAPDRPVARLVLAVAAVAHVLTTCGLASCQPVRLGHQRDSPWRLWWVLSGPAHPALTIALR
jgi:hypothetical protein